MVKFNELNITKDGKSIIIDVSVLDLPYYKDVYISEISIDTQNTYIEGKPSEQAIKVFTAEDNIKTVRKELDNGDILPLIDSNLFYVWVKVKGIPAPETPCNMDKEFTVGVVFYECPIYDNMMQNVKEINSSCNIPTNFINLLLLLVALKLSIKTEHYILANKYYKEFFNNIQLNINPKCECYG